jgi:hypothetical protein
MTLNQSCKDPELKREIETCVAGITRIVVEGSRFLNFYVLRCLEKGYVIPPLNQGLIYSTFAALASPSGASARKKAPKGFTTTMKAFKKMRPDDFKPFSCENVTQMLNFAAADFLVACKNHVVTNYYKRIGNAFFRFLNSLEQKFIADDSYKMKRFYMDGLSKGEGTKKLGISVDLFS